MRGNGHEEPAIVITNDFEARSNSWSATTPAAGAWRTASPRRSSSSTSTAMSSPILVKIHFDVALSMIADTLYSMLAHKLRGFEECDAPKMCRDFVRGKGTVSVAGSQVSVTFPRRAHNPILRGVPWHDLPTTLLAPKGARLTLRFA